MSIFRYTNSVASSLKCGTGYGLLGGRAAISVKECFNVSKFKPVVTAFANTIRFEYTNPAPLPDCVGMHMKQVCYFADCKQPEW